MSISAERFATGMTFDEYMAQMNDNQEQFAANYADARIDQDDVTFIYNLGLPLNVLVLTEDWCTDALLYLPVLARLADTTDSWNLRVLLRDQNLDLADKYLNQGKYRSIPVFVFLDQDMRELAVFIERPAIANTERLELVNRMAEESTLIVAGVPPREQSEKAMELLREPLKQLRVDNTRLWQQAAIDEVTDALQKVMVARTLAEH